MRRVLLLATGDLGAWSLHPPGAPVAGGRDLLAGTAVHRGVIVFTGALRCRDDPAADGPANLADALVAAASSALRGTGVLVCLHGDLHAARWAHQVDADRRPAFSSRPFPVVARVVGGAVELLAAPPARPPAAEGEPESDVALIRTYPGMAPALIGTAVDAGARGVVLEGTGRWNVPVPLFTAIGELIEWNIPVVVATRCRTGNAPFPDVERADGLAARLGAISAGDLDPAKARMALMVALGSGGVDAVRNWFAQL